MPRDKPLTKGKAPIPNSFAAIAGIDHMPGDHINDGKLEVGSLEHEYRMTDLFAWPLRENVARELREKGCSCQDRPDLKLGHCCKKMRLEALREIYREKKRVKMFDAITTNERLPDELRMRILGYVAADQDIAIAKWGTVAGALCGKLNTIIPKSTAAQTLREHFKEALLDDATWEIPTEYLARYGNLGDDERALLRSVRHLKVLVDINDDNIARLQDSVDEWLSAWKALNKEKMRSAVLVINLKICYGPHLLDTLDSILSFSNPTTLRQLLEATVERFRDACPVQDAELKIVLGDVWPYGQGTEVGAAVSMGEGSKEGIFKKAVDSIIVVYQ